MYEYKKEVKFNEKRIVIIGNGFDLYNDLLTSYCGFAIRNDLLPESVKENFINLYYMNTKDW